MTSPIKRYAIAAVVGVIAGCAAFAVEAAGEKVGDKQMCVALQSVDQTPVIDDSTILIKMKGGRDFKRIDLMSPCSGLKIQGGFSHETSTNDLCTSDPLRVLRSGGSVCMIKQIVTIDKAEAKALEARH